MRVNKLRIVESALTEILRFTGGASFPRILEKTSHEEAQQQEHEVSRFF